MKVVVENIWRNKDWRKKKEEKMGKTECCHGDAWQLMESVCVLSPPLLLKADWVDRRVAE